MYGSSSLNFVKRPSIPGAMSPLADKMLICGFMVDEVGLLLQPKGISSSTLMHRYKSTQNLPSLNSG